MTTNWTHDLELRFLETYQCYPIIWDPRHREHKDRNKVHDAWNEISEILNIQPKELKRKKESLMTTFRMHKRKIKSSEHSGAGTDDIYTPIWFAFTLMDSFLGDIMDDNSNKTRNTINIQNTDSSQDDVAATPESVNEERNSTSNEPTPGPSDAPQTIRRRKNPPELIDAGKTRKKALNTLNEVLNQRSASISVQQEDECDLYGRMLAKKLRKFPEHARVNVMYELDGTIIRLLSRSVAPVNTPSPQSAHSSNSEPIFSTNMNRHLLEDRPLSTPAYYISTSPTQQHLPQQKQQQSQLQPARQHFSQQQQPSQHLPQQQASQQYLPQQQQSQLQPARQHLPQQQQLSQHLPQQQASQQYLPQQQQSQQTGNNNTNMQYLLHIPDQPLSLSPSLESTEENNPNSISFIRFINFASICREHRTK